METIRLETINGRQLARISGVSRDQLVRWDRAGVLRGTRVDERRNAECLYSREQALGVIALGELRKAGESDRLLKQAAELLPRTISDAAYLIFTGAVSYLKRTPEEVADLLTRANRAARVLRVDQLVERLGC
jgi:DNA-binding transcriptional MerR regulator